MRCMKKNVGLFDKKISIRLLLSFVIVILGSIEYTYSQKVAIKNNTLYDAVQIPNLNLEIAISPRISLDLNYAYNPFQINENKKWKLSGTQPEIRYWTKKRFKGHFFGIHGGYSIFNIGGIDIQNPVFEDLGSHRFQGTLYNAGLTYGFLWRFSSHWGLETFVGVGYARLNYDKYKCVTCGEKLGTYITEYFGPTKAGISLVYLIK